MSSNFSKVSFIDKIRDIHINRFLQYLKTEKKLKKKQGQASSTINANLRVIKSVLKFAVQSGFLHKNPADNIYKFYDP